MKFMSKLLELHNPKLTATGRREVENFEEIGEEGEVWRVHTLVP